MERRWEVVGESERAGRRAETVVAVLSVWTVMSAVMVV